MHIREELDCLREKVQAGLDAAGELVRYWQEESNKFHMRMLDESGRAEKAEKEASKEIAAKQEWANRVVVACGEVDALRARVSELTALLGNKDLVIEGLHAERDGDNGLIAAKDAGWAIAEARLKRMQTDDKNITQLEAKLKVLAQRLEENEAWGMEWYNRFWEISNILKMPGMPSCFDVSNKVKALFESKKVSSAICRDDAFQIVRDGTVISVVEVT